jgi:hypothetical protein
LQKPIFPNYEELMTLNVNEMQYVVIFSKKQNKERCLFICNSYVCTAK